MRPPCLRKAVRSAAMASLVRLRPTSLPLLGRADRCEVLLDLRGMASPCRWFTVAALALANGMRQLPGRVGCRVVFLVRLPRDARCRPARTRRAGEREVGRPGGRSVGI